MNDYKTRIGSHAQFDDDRYWRFARRADPPIYFDRGISADWLVVAATAVCLIVALIWGW